MRRRFAIARLIFGLGFCGLFVAPAGAAARQSPAHVLVIDTPITPELRDAILATDPADIRVVQLDSAGGSVKDAIAIGQWVRTNNIRTHVPEGAECASSCTIIFQAGVVRSAHPTARFLYHYASQKSTDAQERLMGRVLGTVLYVEALISFGAPESLYRMIPGDRDWRLSADKARRYRIVQVVATDDAGLSED